MDSKRVIMRRPRALPRSRIPQLNQDKENRGRPPMRRKAVINKCSGRTLCTLRRVTKGKTMVEIKSAPASQSQDKLPLNMLKVSTNTPTDKAPQACKISEDDMMMRQINVNDFFDVTMESESSTMSPHGYQSDILSYLKERETLLAIRSESTEPSVDKFNRKVLIDWLIDVQFYLKLENETLHLAIAMMDAFLLKRSISLHYLQLLGITCLFVASKYEEIYIPSLESLCMLCANCYSEGELLVMERRILRNLDFDLFFPTAVDFLTRYLILTDIDDERLILMCNYLVDIGLPSKHSCPSHRAAAALFLALTIRKAETRHKSDDNNDPQKDLIRANDGDETVWDWKLQTITGYSELCLTELAEGMTEKVCAIKDAKYQAPYRKYNVQRFQYISEELAKWFSSSS